MTSREKPRILCVSLSSLKLREICAAFPREYQALPASSPAQAVAVCVTNNIAAVVLDSEFLTHDGCTLAQTFKAVNPHLPIVLLGKGHNGDIPKAVDAVATTNRMMLKKLVGLVKFAK
jgi:DNA-binding NtrC family response regulator